MPLQRRLPKGGFRSRVAVYHDEIRLHELTGLAVDVVDIDALKAAGLIRNDVRSVKVILSGDIGEAVRLKGLLVTKGARAAIESAGGSIEV
jgi:large subunit ribosomal protein L15